MYFFNTEQAWAPMTVEVFLVGASLPAPIAANAAIHPARIFVGDIFK